MSSTTTTTTTTTIIRPRQPSDLPSCASLLARVHAIDGYPVQGVSNAIEFLSSPSTLQAWVAEETESAASTTTTTTYNNNNNNNTTISSPNNPPPKLLGHVSLTLPPPTSTDPAVTLWRSQSPTASIAVLERLFVDPCTRGQGLAAKLLRAASAEADKRGLRAVLFALVKDEGAMRLYARVGWREFGRGVFGYRDGEGREKVMEAVCFVSEERE